jgi:hypothetical protein
MCIVISNGLEQELNAGYHDDASTIQDIFILSIVACVSFGTFFPLLIVRFN